MMRKVFADTLYWIAIVKPRDPYFYCPIDLDRL